MKATAIVKGKVVTFQLSPGLAAAHRRNRGKSLDEAGAIEFVEKKRRQRAQRRASAYVEGGR
jgi:hypothetical protein